MPEKKIIISGEIGFFGTMPMDVRAQLIDAAGEDIDIQISSPGGFVFDGIEIYNMIRDYKRDNPGAQITITLKGEAASMASYIAMNPAADMIIAEDNAVFMIHNPWDFSAGDYRAMEKSAELLRGIGSILVKAYSDRSGKTLEEIQALMDSESFFFGEEIKAAGFVDEIIGAPAEEKTEKEQAVAASRIKIAALQDKMRKSEQAKADILKVAALIKHEHHAQNELTISGAAAPKNNNGGATMADEKNLISADDVTMDWLEANKPDIITAIKNAATEEEKTRQQEIDETEENTDDDSEEAKALFKAARYGKEPMGSGEVAKKLFAMQSERKKKAAADRTEDGRQVPAVTTDVNGESDAVAGIRAGMKIMRRIK